MQDAGYKMQDADPMGAFSGSVLGARCPALGANPVPGIRYPVPGSRYPTPGTWHRIP